MNEIIFVTDVGVLTIETFLIERKLVFKRVLLKQMRQFHLLKPLDIVYETFEILRIRYVLRKR